MTLPVTTSSAFNRVGIGWQASQRRIDLGPELAVPTEDVIAEGRQDVIVEAIGRVDVLARSRLQEFEKAERFTRRQKGEKRALILREAAPKERAEEHGSDWVERPASVQMTREGFAVPTGSLVYRFRHRRHQVIPARHGRPLLNRLERRGNEPHELVRFLVKDEIGKAPLDLGPFVALASGQAHRILIEGLVEDGNEQKRFLRIRRGQFSQGLEQLKVASVRMFGGVFENLSSFVDNEKQTCSESGLDGGDGAFETAHDVARHAPVLARLESLSKSGDFTEHSRPYTTSRRPLVF
jgi:hypothetical protein